MTVQKRIVGAAALMAAVIAIAIAQSGSSPSLITPKDASALIRNDSTAVILDVRTADEYYGETGHLPKAILVPVQALEERMTALDQFKDRTVLVYCRTGHRSTTAAEILQKHGFHVRNLEGGITRWNDEHFPVVREKR